MIKLLTLLSVLQMFNFKTDSTLKVVLNKIFLNKIDSLQNSDFLKNGFLGVSIKNCKTGKSIVSYNSHKSLAPASTLKLITTATALAILGENYKYQTNLQMEGQIKNDTLFGNINIIGSGDPSLGSGRFTGYPKYNELIAKWAQTIMKLGIKVIIGNVKSNENTFESSSIPDTWQWGDIGNYYGAGSFGLNINENILNFYFKTANKINEPTALVEISPNLPEFIYINETTTDSKNNGDQSIIYSSPNGSYISAKGKLPASRERFLVKGAIPNPPQLVETLLIKELQKFGISINNKSKNIQLINQPKITINTETSPTLFELCMATNFQSLNLYAECFIKTLAVKSGFQGNTKDGIEVLKAFWAKKNVNLDGFHMEDGSGLSPTNYITSENMCDVLSAASSEPFFTAFHQGIAVLGEDGTVKNVGKKSKAAGNVRAKSGTIDQVKAYAGYFTAKNGDLICFSMAANRFVGSESKVGKELSKLMVEMVELE